MALDADETVISNVQFEKELRLAGGDFSTASFTDWTARREATLLPGVMGFLDRVRELGGKIAIVTNRRQPTCPDTDANLKASSPRWRSSWSRPGKSWMLSPSHRMISKAGRPGAAVPSSTRSHRGSFSRSSVRHKSTSKGTDKAYGRFGAEFFILPNPMYGSWEDNPEE